MVSFATTFTLLVVACTHACLQSKAVMAKKRNCYSRSLVWKSSQCVWRQGELAHPPG